MTTWPAGLVTIILVTVSTITADRRSVKLCPCTQGCCDENWFQYKDACYLPVKIHQTWKDAEKSCETQNADLVSIHTPEEDWFIFYLMEGRGGYWLGAKKINTGRDSHWTWTDDSSWQYASVKLHSKSQWFRDHVIVERYDDDDNDDDNNHNGHISWDYEISREKRHMFVCKYLLV